MLRSERAWSYKQPNHPQLYTLSRPLLCRSMPVAATSGSDLELLYAGQGQMALWPAHVC